MKKLRITFNSPVVLGFIFICLAVLILGYATLGMSNELLFMTYHSGLTNPMTYIRFFTHVLGHSGWEHYIGNAAYILLLGPMLEEKYGSKKLLQVIVITALVTGVMNYILFPQVALCGASGVVFAFIILSQIKIDMEEALGISVDIVHGPITEDDMIDIDSEVVLYAA